LRNERKNKQMASTEPPVVGKIKDPPGTPDEPVAEKPGGQPTKVLAWAAFAVAVLVAFALRAYRLDVSWDIFLDEIYYLQVSQGVLNTLWVNEGDADRFYLHPPGLFFLEAGYMKLLGIRGGLIEQIYAVRYLGAALAALSAGALLWMGRRLAGWPAGITAAAIFALDPFSIKVNGLNMLETPTMLWVLLGYGVLFSALVREDHLISRRRVAAAGLLFGLALLTKEISAFLTLLPLGGCFVLGWAMPRARSALAGVVALAVYSVYPAVVYAIGDWETFVDQKFLGVWRLIGLLQLTGFNQSGGPSLLDAVLSRLDEFATTYVLLATGALAAAILLFTRTGRTPARRLLLAWIGSAYAFLAYAMVLGTLEEQFYYYLVVTSILATVATTAFVLQEMRTEGPERIQRRRTARGSVVAVLVAAFALWSGYVWTGTHTVPDNGYERVVEYVEDLPESSRVAVTSTTTELLVKDHAGTGKYTSVAELREENVDYVVISAYLATRGYRQPPPKVYLWVKNEGRRVYGFKNRSTGLVGVWSLQEGAGDARPAPDGAPTLTPGANGK
jgi:hypothetical protein